MTEPAALSGALRGALLPALLVAGLALVPYLRTYRFEATYDDHDHLVANAFLRDPRTPARILTGAYLAEEVPDHGRPVTLLSFALDRRLFGEDVGAWHLCSALWHALASLLFLFVARAVRMPWAHAAAAAALFALHPAHAEAVAGVSNREDPIAAALALGALLAGCAALWRHAAFSLLSGLLLALALLAKESALAALPLFAVVAAARGRPRAPRRRWIALGASAAAALIPAALLQIHLGFPSLLSGAGGAPLSRSSLGVWLAIPRAQSPLLAGPVELVRAAQVTFGWPLSAVHDLEPLRTPLAIAAGWLGLFVLAAVALRLRRRAPWLALGAAWFFAATLPVLASHLLINPLADRYLYLPAGGAAIAIAATLPVLASHLLINPLADRYLYLPAGGAASAIAGTLGRASRGRAALVLVLGLYAALAAARIGVWRDDVVLFEDAVAHAPSDSRAWQNLGAARLARRDLNGAERALLRACALEPDLLAAHLNLAALAERDGRTDAAITHLERAVAIDPVSGELPLHERALARLLVLLQRRGRVERMHELVEAELRARPESAAARAWRARLAAPASQTP